MTERPSSSPTMRSAVTATVADLSAGSIADG
jgi:hypothetical protein